MRPHVSWPVGPTMCRHRVGPSFVDLPSTLGGTMPETAEQKVQRLADRVAELLNQNDVGLHVEVHEHQVGLTVIYSTVDTYPKEYYSSRKWHVHDLENATCPDEFIIRGIWHLVQDVEERHYLDTPGTEAP